MSSKGLLFASCLSLVFCGDSSASQASGCYPENKLMSEYWEEQVRKVQSIKEQLRNLSSNGSLEGLSREVDDVISCFETQMTNDPIAAGYICLPYLHDDLYGIKLVLDWKKKSPNSIPQCGTKVFRIILQNKDLFEKVFPNLQGDL